VQQSNLEASLLFEAPLLSGTLKQKQYFVSCLFHVASAFLQIMEKVYMVLF